MCYFRCGSCEMGLVGRGETHLFPLVTPLALSRNFSLSTNGCGNRRKLNPSLLPLEGTTPKKFFIRGNIIMLCSSPSSNLEAS